MPTVDVTSPDGRKIRVNAPAGATQDQIYEYAQQQIESLPPPELPTSQVLGAEEGAVNVWDRAASGTKWLANTLSIPFGGGAGEAIDIMGRSIGLASEEETEGAHQNYFAHQEEKYKPGEVGRFAGELAATLPVAIENPWAAGAAIGGLTGHSHSLPGVAGDVTLGMLGGGATHHLLGAAGSALSPALRGAKGRALDYVSRLASQAKKTPEEIAAYGDKAFGKPVMGAEAVGRQGHQAVTALGRREGATADKLEGALLNRIVQRRERFYHDVSTATGIDPRVARGDLDALVEQGRENASPYYSAAWFYPERISDHLQIIAEDPLVQAGMRRGINIAIREARAKGERIDPSAYGIIKFTGAGEPVLGKMPTWRTWDAAKRGIDAILREPPYTNPLTQRLNMNEETKAILDLRTAMLGEVDKLNPVYAHARSEAADYMQARNAYDKGSEALFDDNVNEHDYRNIVARMNPTEHKALMGGVANKIFELAQQGRLKPTMLETARIKEKLATTYGEERAQQLIGRFKTEADMAAFEKRAMPGTGSVTSEVLNAGEEQGRFTALANDLAHAAMYKAGGMGHAANFRLADALKREMGRFFAFMQTGPMSIEARDEVGRLLMLPPKELAEELRSRPQSLRLLSRVVQMMEKAGKRVGSAGAAQANPAAYEQTPPPE